MDDVDMAVRPRQTESEARSVINEIGFFDGVVDISCDDTASPLDYAHIPMRFWTKLLCRSRDIRSHTNSREGSGSNTK